MQVFPHVYILISLSSVGSCGGGGGHKGSCVRKGGQIEPDSCCEETAHDWVYSDPQKPECHPGPKNIPCDPIPPTAKPCPLESPLCDILLQP